MRIRIDKAGMMSTLQDKGRWGYLTQGVPISGAMDTLSARVANLALGNPPHVAVIEFTYGGAVLLAETDILIAYAGEGAVVETDARVLPPDRPLYIPSGTELRLTNNPMGSRTYLAVAGGWAVPDVLGSKSTYIAAGFGGYRGRALQTGDVLTAQQSFTDGTAQLCSRLRSKAINYPRWSIAKQLLLPRERKAIQVVPAHEFTWFQGQSVVDFLSAPFTVTIRSNRMGYRLEGPPIRKLEESRELLSTAVAPGTIQVTGDGNLMLLMADCQTTGGYPRIAQVAAVDMPLCAQLNPGDQIYFHEISRIDAEKQYIHRENQLKRLAVGLMAKQLTDL